ncbi:ABC transporter permease [Clostridium hydrogenum]|uniref:ABC transporter permease n=1 Tax=Clostridium hydrogenum TaxID=2855764 RepID=UPI001F1F97D8|nr:ABC transporter permease [Clostridium hydrogenum]
MFKAMFIKDIKNFSSSIKLYIFTMLIFPISLAFFYGAMYKNTVNPDRNLQKVKLAFVDYDKSKYSNGIETIFKNDKLKKFIDFNNETNMEDIKKKLQNGKIDAAIEIPKGFSTSIQNGTKTNIKMLKALSASGETEVVYGIINSYLDVINNNSMVISTLKSNVNSKQKVNAIISKIVPETVALSTGNYSKVTSLKLYKKITATQYFAGSMLAFTGFFIAIVAATMMIKEIKNGTMNRLMSTSVTYFKLYVEKLVLAFCISAAFIGAYVIINCALGIVWSKNLIEILSMIILQAFALTGITAFLMSVFKNTKILNMICVPIIMLFACFGGSFYYVDNAAIKVNYMKFTLNYWIGDAYNKLMLGNSMSSITMNLVIIFAVGVVGISIGTLIAKRKSKVYG